MCWEAVPTMVSYLPPIPLRVESHHENIESSSDSDFRIDDFDSDNSKDDDDEEGDDNSSTTSSNDDEDDESDKESEDSTLQLKQLLADASEEISNEIVECDGCGVSVHEGCYGVSDNNSISSTNSTCSTEPWFCEACRAGVSEPSCELCPNTGGIYKETDVGKWVHLVCALYVPGVAFGEDAMLVCAKTFSCYLCTSCWILTEAHHEDTDAADPFMLIVKYIPKGADTET
ncbi:PHD finger protein 14 [Eumeta japonica]|uniref:PHD finger protein 14 n=1 Tax=Eumeta variegata TaxID=151549 RepID=A0A4C1TIF2_EUMVA|nr:PHD finger protein 14 [Eumeta japonica]